MKQRLGMAQALINRPDLIFLDEPTSALDPIGRKEVLEAVGALAGQMTVFFSTHILNDVERVCDTVAILNHGRLVTQQRIHELRASYASHCIYVEFEGQPDLPASWRGSPGRDRPIAIGEGWRIHPTDLPAAQSGLPELVCRPWFGLAPVRVGRAVAGGYLRKAGERPMTGERPFFKKEFREILRTLQDLCDSGDLPLAGLAQPHRRQAHAGSGQVHGAGDGDRAAPARGADAYAQLLKNLNQLALLVVIFSLIGLVAEEKSRGTAAIILTKPVPRWSFITSKFLASAVLVLLSTLLAYLACLYYTAILFRETLFAPSVQAIILVMAYYLLILAVTLLASTVSRTIALAGAISVGGFLLLSLLPSFHPWLARYSPGALPRYQGQLLTRAGHPGGRVPRPRGHAGLDGLAGGGGGGPLRAAGALGG